MLPLIEIVWAAGVLWWFSLLLMVWLNENWKVDKIKAIAFICTMITFSCSISPSAQFSAHSLIYNNAKPSFYDAKISLTHTLTQHSHTHTVSLSLSLCLLSLLLDSCKIKLCWRLATLEKNRLVHKSLGAELSCNGVLAGVSGLVDQFKLRPAVMGGHCIKLMGGHWIKLMAGYCWSGRA